MTEKYSDRVWRLPNVVYFMLARIVNCISVLVGLYTWDRLLNKQAICAIPARSFFSEPQLMGNEGQGSPIPISTRDWTVDSSGQAGKWKRAKFYNTINANQSCASVYSCWENCGSIVPYFQLCCTLHFRECAVSPDKKYTKCEEWHRASPAYFMNILNYTQIQCLDSRRKQKAWLAVISKRILWSSTSWEICIVNVQECPRCRSVLHMSVHHTFGGSN